MTVKLSQRFYERFGDEIANELVGLLNSVDATYRSDLRELNELNFARFEAKLDQRVAELRQEVREGLANLRSELIKWMFVFWTGTMLSVAAFMYAVLRAR